MESALVLGAVLVFMAIGFAWPILRVFRRHRVWPVVFGREAAPAQRLLGWLTRMLLVAVVGSSVARFVIGPGPLGIWCAAGWVRAAGWLLVVGGTVLVVVAQRRMGASFRVGIDDRPTRLVTSGPFALVRNPIFSGLLLWLAGWVCLSPASWTLALWLATFGGIRAQIALEERHLVSSHGAAYLAYAARVGRLVPGVGRLAGRGLASDWFGRS